MAKAENMRALDMGGIPSIFANKIVSVEIVDGIVRIVFAETKTVGDALEAIAVLELLRPLDDCLTWTLRDLIHRAMTADGRMATSLQPLH